MAANNTFTLVGNITKDPIIKTTANGKKFVCISLAVNSIKDKPDFFNVFAWNKMAEIIAKYSKKGDGIALSGTVSTSNKDGITSYMFTADDAKFIYKARANTEAPKAEPKPAPVEELDPAADFYSPVSADPFGLN